MKIRNHRLIGDDVTRKDSPNKGGQFAEGLPDTIVIHYTAGGSLDSSVNTLCDPNTKASAHLVVGRDGRIVQLVSFNTIAWHAGRSAYQGRVGLNKYSIGIEIDNAGRLNKSGDVYFSWFGRNYTADEVLEAVHRNETVPSYWHRYTEEQINVVQEICTLLTRVYPINTILGHEEISPSRKTDPGPAFPLDKLRERILQSDRSMDEAEEITIAGKTGIVTASRLNIRSDSSLSASTIAPPLYKGTKLKILEEREGWYKVDVQIEGWVKKEYVQT